MTIIYEDNDSIEEYEYCREHDFWWYKIDVDDWRQSDKNPFTVRGYAFNIIHSKYCSDCIEFDIHNSKCNSGVSNYRFGGIDEPDEFGCNRFKLFEEWKKGLVI